MSFINLTPPIPIDRVRYIKLGGGGGWAADCIDQKTIRIGFQTNQLFELCSNHRWDEFQNKFIAWTATRGEAKRKANQVKAVFEDNGRTLWITFHARCLWWAIIDENARAEKSPDGDGTLRKLKCGWSKENMRGSVLHMDTLSGHLTKLAAFRGASCGFEDIDYVIRKLNGEQIPEVREAEELSRHLKQTIEKMLKRLGAKDLSCSLIWFFLTADGDA